MINKLPKLHIGIVIDMQNDFCGEQGALSNAETISVVMPLTHYLHTHHYDLLFATKDTHNENYLETSEGKYLAIPHCIKGTVGHNLIPSISTFPFSKIINKDTFGYRDWSSLFAEQRLLADCPVCNYQIDIMGVCTDICIITNAILLRVLFPDAEIRVVSDLCAGTSIDRHQKALDVMQSCQISIVTSNNI